VSLTRLIISLYLLVTTNTIHIGIVGVLCERLF